MHKRDEGHEYTWAVDRHDTTPDQHTYPTGYSVDCTMCYAGFSHTEALHAKRIAEAQAARHERAMVCSGCGATPETVAGRDDDAIFCGDCWSEDGPEPDDAPTLAQLSETLMDPDTVPIHYAKAKIAFDALTEAMDAGWTPSLLELAQEQEDALEFGGPVARLLGLPLSPPEFGRAA